MRFNSVCRETNQLDAPPRELGLQFCKSTQLCCANGGVVLWMRKENSPFVANPLVEVNRAIGSIGLEIGGNGAKTQPSYLVSISNGVILRSSWEVHTAQGAPLIMSPFL